MSREEGGGAIVSPALSPLKEKKKNMKFDIKVRVSPRIIRSEETTRKQTASSKRRGGLVLRTTLASARPQKKKIAGNSHKILTQATASPFSFEEKIKRGKMRSPPPMALPPK